MRHALLGTTLLAAGLIGAPAFAPPAFAQSNPSADQILDALRPTAGSLHGATRGIRAVGPAPSADPAPAAAAPRAHAAVERVATAQPPAAAQASAPSVNLLVEFKSGSAELTPAAIRSLDELGKALASPQLAAFRFRIEGHTDTVGSPELNKALSDQRAKAVSSYLADKFGVAPARLEPVGMGSDDLAVPTGPQVPEARNRRVQVVNLGA